MRIRLANIHHFISLLHGVALRDAGRGSEIRSCLGAEAARGDRADCAGVAAGRGDVGFGRGERAGGAGCAHGRAHARRRPPPLRAPRALHRRGAAGARRAHRLARGSIHRGPWPRTQGRMCAFSAHLGYFTLCQTVGNVAQSMIPSVMLLSRTASNLACVSPWVLYNVRVQGERGEGLATSNGITEWSPSPSGVEHG
ncbi:unnamed protein product [Closterium sp. Yama58-4]|nr:unnamed protein product [Closterium sp. Yama58-4]